MSDEGRPGRRLMIGLIVGLMLWGSMLALGAYLHGGDPQHPTRDPRKAVVVLGATAAFLAFWGGALLLRKRRS